MRMPGFSAELSLAKSEPYRSTWNETQQTRMVQPAQNLIDLLINPCGYCIRNCRNRGNRLTDCAQACTFGGLCD
jgi:hypothetical protein